MQTPIEVIPNFVNCDLYHRTPEVMKHRSEYATPDEKILVHLSNFRPVKRVQDVIEIFDRVQKKIPARLLMIGDGPERSRAEWLAVNKGIHNKVDFLGKQDRIHEKLGVADVMLHAQRAGILRPGGAGGDGLRGRSHRDQRRRRARSHRSRQDRFSGECRRRGRHGALMPSSMLSDDDKLKRDG